MPRLAWRRRRPLVAATAPRHPLPRSSASCSGQNVCFPDGGGGGSDDGDGGGSDDGDGDGSGAGSGDDHGSGAGSGADDGDHDGGAGPGQQGDACTTDADCGAGLECELEQGAASCQPHGGH